MVDFNIFIQYFLMCAQRSLNGEFITFLGQLERIIDPFYCLSQTRFRFVWFYQTDCRHLRERLFYLSTFNRQIVFNTAENIPRYKKHFHFLSSVSKVKYLIIMNFSFSKLQARISFFLESLKYCFLVILNFSSIQHAFK